jgi:hypothetical protein
MFYIYQYVTTLPRERCAVNCTSLPIEFHFIELLHDRKKEWAKNADSIKAARKAAHVFWG